MLNAALSHITSGWSVIPLQPRGKRPLLAAWEEYQSHRATEDEIREWFTRWPGANLAIITGCVSGLVVLDLDGPAAVQAARERGGLPPTPCVVTRRGYHYYLQHPGQPVKNAVALDGVKGLDVRADGGYVVAPPSVHPSGRQYRWARGRSPDDLPLAPCPAWLLEMLANRGRAQAVDCPTEPGWVESLLRGVQEGQRDDAATRLAGHYLGKGLPESEVLALLLAWNQRNQPPLPERDVEKCVRSVASRESRKPARPARLQPGFRLDGPVHAPQGWRTMVICRDWQEARKLAAQGNAVAVCRRDGTLPSEATQLVATASDIKIAGFSSEEARRLAWELYPLRLVRAATDGTAALKPELKPEPAQEPEPEPELEPVPAPAPPPAPESDPANRFLLECWLNAHRPDLLAAVRRAEAQVEEAWWDAQAGFPEALRAAEAALAEALEAGRAAVAGEQEPEPEAEAEDLAAYAARLFGGVVEQAAPAEAAYMERVFAVKGPVVFRLGKRNFTRWLSPGDLAAAPKMPARPERDFTRRPWPEGRREYPDPLEICPVNPLDFRWKDGVAVLEPGWWKRPG